MGTETATPRTEHTPAAPSASAAPAATPSDDAGNAAAIAAATLVTPEATTPTPEAAPVAYTLALPKDATIDDGAVERLTAFAKAEQLSPDVAQKALDLANEEVAADRARHATASAETFKQMAFTDWPAQIKAHPTYGGEHYDATMLHVKRVADLVVTPYPERVEALNKTGWGNHPLLIQMFADIGAKLAPGAPITGHAGGPRGTPKTDAEVLYPNTPAPTS